MGPIWSPEQDFETSPITSQLPLLLGEKGPGLGLPFRRGQVRQGREALTCPHEQDHDDDEHLAGPQLLAAPHLLHGHLICGERETLPRGSFRPQPFRPQF